MRLAADWARWVALAAVLVAVTTGATVQTAVSARAAGVPFFGSNLGWLTLNPATGPLSTTPTWSTLTPCPSGFQGSAVLDELNTDGSIALAISAVVTNVTTPFSGTLLAGDTVASVLGASNVTDAGTVEWVVACSAGAGGTGNRTYVQATDVTLATDGSGYTTACTQANMCLIPSSGASSLTPTWATLGPCPVDYLFSAALYTLNADGSLGTQISPVVSNVQVPFGGTLLADVAQNMAGTGVTNGQKDEWAVVCFGGAGGTGPADPYDTVNVTLSADGSSYTTSSTLPSPVPAGQVAGTVPVALTIPPTGALTVTVAPGTVTLTELGTTLPQTATGLLNAVSVVDTRNTYPGWSVSAQDSVFTGSGTAAGSTIAGDELGWVPTQGGLAGGVTLGPPVTPGTNPGLGDAAQVLASATPGVGFGTSILGATLTLEIPASTHAGSYVGTLTITYLLGGP